MDTIPLAFGGIVPIIAMYTVKIAVGSILTVEAAFDACGVCKDCTDPARRCWA